MPEYVETTAPHSEVGVVGEASPRGPGGSVEIDGHNKAPMAVKAESSTSGRSRRSRWQYLDQYSLC